MFKLKERLNGIDKQTLLFKGGLIALMVLMLSVFFFLGLVQLGVFELGSPNRSAPLEANYFGVPVE